MISKIFYSRCAQIAIFIASSVLLSADISRLVNEFLAKDHFSTIFTNPFQKRLKFWKRDDFSRPLCSVKYCLKAKYSSIKLNYCFISTALFAFRFTIPFQRPHINKPKSAHSVESQAGIKRIASRKSKNHFSSISINVWKSLPSAN